MVFSAAPRKKIVYGRNLCARSPLLVTSRKRRRHRRCSNPAPQEVKPKKGSGSDVRFKRGARPHILSSSNQRRPQRCRLVGKCSGQALHPIHPVLAYRRYRRRLSLPACRRAAYAGAAWESRVYDGARENSGSVRQGIDLSLLKSGDYTHFRAAMLASSRQVISLMFS